MNKIQIDSGRRKIARSNLINDDWFYDGLIEAYGGDDEEFFAAWTDEDENMFDAAFVTLAKLWCKYAEHSPESDQCGIPDHDYCIVCGESMPGAAH